MWQACKAQMVPTSKRPHLFSRTPFGDTIRLRSQCPIRFVEKKARGAQSLGICAAQQSNSADKMLDPTRRTVNIHINKSIRSGNLVNLCAVAASCCTTHGHSECP